MAKITKIENFFKIFGGYYKLSRSKRISILQDYGVINADDCAMLTQDISEVFCSDADFLVENSIGCFPLPLGIATNCVINEIPTLIPMATEETSVIAALSGAGKWVNEHKGKIQTSQQGKGIRGQLYFREKSNFSAIITYFNLNKDALISDLNNRVVPSMKKRGGGVFSLEYRRIQDSSVADEILVLDICMDCCEAMGANLICQVSEALKSIISKDLGVAGDIAIVSNLSDCQTTTASLVIPSIDSDFAEKIVAANNVARADIYRAVTHNKGILNGVDAVALATGNDWRAIEASLHGYAAKGGYTPLTSWEFDGESLVGQLTAPFPAASLGGATTQKMVKVCHKILNLRSAQQLSGIFAAVGLLQNFAALKALTTKGIVAGHMRLHINNLILATDATSSESKRLKILLEERLCLLGKLTLTDSLELLHSLRLSEGQVR
ncbi:MAG: hydroxymethylglutaryl-CoA reductase, degradative [Pseudomonadota bacterium]|nr:hydroxymethylglutaryl-CoA reductase, degradative [Pseudomonadota bacterium]